MDVDACSDSLFAVAAVALVAFVLLELHQRLPMLDLSLFRNPTFAGANAAMLLVGLAMFGIFFYNSLLLQRVLGYSAIETGATFLPMTVLIILVAPIAGRFSDRIGARWLMGAGMTLLAVSLLLFGTLDANSSFWNILAGPARRRCRDGGHDGADDGCGDGLRSRGQGRCWLRCDQQHAPGRRLARDRDHGRARGDERQRPADESAVAETSSWRAITEQSTSAPHSSWSGAIISVLTVRQLPRREGAAESVVGAPGERALKRGRPPAAAPGVDSC